MAFRFYHIVVHESWASSAYAWKMIIDTGWWIGHIHVGPIETDVSHICNLHATYCYILVDFVLEFVDAFSMSDNNNTNLSKWVLLKQMNLCSDAYSFVFTWNGSLWTHHPSMYPSFQLVYFFSIRFASSVLLSLSLGFISTPSPPPPPVITVKTSKGIISFDVAQANAENVYWISVDNVTVCCVCRSRCESVEWFIQKQITLRQIQTLNSRKNV